MLLKQATIKVAHISILLTYKKIKPTFKTKNILKIKDNKMRLNKKFVSFPEFCYC